MTTPNTCGMSLRASASERLSPRALRERDRERSGLSLSEAARRMGIGPAYFRQFELHGGAPDHFVERLQAALALPRGMYLHWSLWDGAGQPWRRQPTTRAARRHGAPRRHGPRRN